MQPVTQTRPVSKKALWAGYIMSAIPVLMLLTGYLGGAVLAHLRVGDPFFGPVIFGVLVWGGLFLRDPRLRALIPFRCQPASALSEQRPAEVATAGE